MYQFKKCVFIPLLFYLYHVDGQVYTETATRCDHSYAIDISHGKRDEKTKQITFDNVTYAEDKYFLHDDMIWGCVCDVQLCITKCCIESTDSNYTCKDGFTHDVRINIYDDDLTKAGDNVRHVSAHPRKCSFYELDPLDSYHFRMDGKLHFDDQDYNLHEYCIMGNKEENLTVVQVCFDEEQMGGSSQTEDVHIYVLPILCKSIQAISKKCVDNNFINISQGIYNNLTKDITFNNVVYPSDKYLKQNNDIFVCLCDIQLCLPKCCTENKSGKVNCDSGYSLGVKVDTYYDNLTMAEKTADHISVYWKPCNFFILDEGEDYFIMNDGRLLISQYEAWFELNQYCLIQNSNHPEDYNMEVRVCSDEEDSADVDYINLSNSYGMLVSVPFLFATLLVNLIINDRKINTRCLMAYVLCLMLSYIILIVLQFKNSMESPECEIVAAFGVYFFMATFCWMNVTCVDMYLTFSGRRGISHGTSSKWKRFGLYTLFANGIPILLLGLIFGLNSREPFRGHPEFGLGQCWIADGLPLLLYFYGPMAILLIINVVLFSITAHSIRKTIKHTREVLHSKESHRHSESNKQDFVLYFRIFLAMGINWSMEFISWLVDWCLGQNKVTWVWYPTDFCNAIYGIFIFFCFVWKKDVLNKLKQKYYKLLGKHHLARTFNVTTSAYTSHTERTNIDESVAAESMKMDRMESVLN